MKSMNRLYVPAQSRRGRRHVRYFCLGIVCAVSLIGCVSKSRYESVASEMDGLRAELGRAQAEIHALEQQRAALEKLNLDGERLLAAIRKELLQARAGYEEYKAEQSRLNGLKARARALQSEQQKHIQGIKAAKRDELKMQAVIDRYEKDMQQVPDIGDVLRVSQAAEPKDDGSRLVATVTPLPEKPSVTANTSTSAVQPTSPPISAPQVATGPVVSPAPATVTAPSPVLAAPAQTAAATPTAAAAPKPQPAPAEESWIGSLTGWLSSVWWWLFS
jgi:hypothetical protein